MAAGIKIPPRVYTMGERVQEGRADMTDRRWRKWELAGLCVTLICGNLLHFVYDWSGGNRIVAAFAAVNESTWEHMKLLAIPWVVWSLAEAVALRNSRRPVLTARALGLLTGLVLIPAAYYICTGALGINSMLVDVLLFQAAVLLGALVSWCVIRSGILSGPVWSIVGLLVLLGVWALMVWWTYMPPLLPVFIDPVDGTAGVSFWRD